MSDKKIILYHYAYSPYARRIQWYLALRGLPYSECIQPPAMPRPDLALLGVQHRRIPVLAIGREIYVDTRLILEKLEQSFPSKPPLGTSGKNNVEHLALERLLEAFTIDGGVFFQAARLIPTNTPLMRDKSFRKDRQDFFGNLLVPDEGSTLAMYRAEALVEMRSAAALLENTLLSDGRDWILATAAPSLADIQAIWPFHWLGTMPGAFFDGSGSTEAGLTAEQFPRLFAWIDRFDTALRAARKAVPRAQKLTGEQAAADITTASPLSSPVCAAVDPQDPVARAAGLAYGKRVVVWPADTGKSGRDIGRLVRLDLNEVVVAVTPPKSSSELLLHAPRHGFRVRPAEDGDAKL